MVAMLFLEPVSLPGGRLFTHSVSSLLLQGILKDLLLYKMLGFLKRPVVVTADINLNVVALTAVGLLSRLWQLAYPRAVV